MNKEIVYIGVDVDDNAFHATAVFPKSGEIVEIKSKPTFQGLKPTHNSPVQLRQ